MGYDIIHVVGDVYVMAYHDEIVAVKHGRLATITIDTDGNIGAVPIDILEFSALLSWAMTLILISPTVVAVAYSSETGSGRIKTVSVDALGNLGAVIDTLDYGQIVGTGRPRDGIIHVSGDIYAIVKRGPGSDGWLVTVSIDAAGNIGAAAIDTFEFDDADCDYPDIVYVSGDVYAIAYKGTGSVGKIVTVSIDAAGNIGAAVIDSLQFDVAIVEDCRVRYVSGDIYAIIYSKDAAHKGFITTVDIDPAGNIGAVIDTQEISVNNQALAPYILHVSGDVYLAVFSGDSAAGGSDFYANSWPIDSAGNIGVQISGRKLKDTLITIDYRDMPCVYVGGQVYAALFSMANSAYLVTFPVETLFGGGPGGRNIAESMVKAVLI